MYFPLFLSSICRDGHFDMAKADNPKIQFLRPSWIRECNDKGMLVPTKSHEVRKGTLN